MPEYSPNPIHQQLVYDLSKGDEKAFEKLYKLFSEKIYQVSRRMNLGHEDAEGIVQEVFLKIWKNRTQLNPELSINAYLIAIVRSLVIKKVKKDARFFAFQQYNIPIIQGLSSSGPEDDLIFEEFHQLTSDIIQQLPNSQRKIFILRNFENLSVEEIAEQLQLSRRTVENQIFRANKTVKEKLLRLKIISSSVPALVSKAVLFSVFS